MVDGLHIHTWNRTMKPLAIALSGAERMLWEGGDGRGNLTSVQCKTIGIAAINPPIQWIYANKNKERKKSMKKSKLVFGIVLVQFW
jgi:hypothetical protein